MLALIIGPTLMLHRNQECTGRNCYLSLLAPYRLPGVSPEFSSLQEVAAVLSPVSFSSQSAMAISIK